MACRGVHFAITPSQAEQLLAAAGDHAVMALVEQIEETWDRDNLAESDKAWDAMHRCLTDGRLAYGNGPYPLNHCVLGPRQLYHADDYIVSLVSPEEVQAVARALEPISAEWFRDQYANVVPADYAPEYGPEDLEYTWSWFQRVRALYQQAAARGRAIIFTVDQ
jgi:hypothetical protein